MSSAHVQHRIAFFRPVRGGSGVGIATTKVIISGNTSNSVRERVDGSLWAAMKNCL